MVNRFLKFGIFFLSLIFCLQLIGCQASDGSVFDGNSSNNSQTPSTSQGRRFSFQQMDTSFPTQSEIQIQENQIASNSIYIRLSSVDLGDNVFQLDIVANQIQTSTQQIYDMPLVLRFNSSLLKIADSSAESVSLIEGNESVRLRSYLDPQFSILVGRTETNPLSRVGDCGNECGYYWIAHSLTREIQARNFYDGVLLSVLVNVRSAGKFSTPIGFDTQNSSVLDRNGTAIDVRYVGGMIQSVR